jgi:2-polyprenyl-3-methyl-5-hydroxy-6-metoxy-1,4-benzoquinol methylase
MRDYNKEALDHQAHKYAYSFDYIMHKFLMRTFQNFKPSGKALEMGCYHGEFTQLMTSYFDDVTAIEASEECITIAKERTSKSIKYILGTFEETQLTEKYDAIFLLHTLEHIDDRVGVLTKAKSWLSSNGLLFVASPNANAPSRQIAVKMGLIPHNSAITEPEKAHGHTITYSLDVLEKEAIEAGLHVQARGGVFFKGLANFQLDKALEANIISQEYLEGCYQLGNIYPDLCSSIYVVCKKEK